MYHAVKKILGLSSVDESHDSFSKLTQQKRVFLSFRGEDTRDNFMSHLRAEFQRKQIEVYIDDESLPRGEEISPALLNAIEGSALAVIIFSVNYANSSWCLDELVHILKCRERHGMVVIPVFYNVDPSHVRKQKGDFEISLNRIKKVRLQGWIDALTAAANLSGWDSSTYRNDARLVEIIAGDIIQKWRGEPAVDFTGEGLIGFPERLKAVESMLEIGSADVRIIGIGGMGGIGKTTLADKVYRRISFQFDACCFLANVGDKWKEGRGACKLQDKLISVLFHGENVQYRTFDYNRLKLKKVLIVLDDVRDSRQLDVITRGRDWYGPGSRIILTSRDEAAFVGLDGMFKVPELSTDEALELFQSKAFLTNPLTEDQIKGSKKAVLDHFKTDFNPFALTSLASNLRGKSLDRWDGILEKMREYPDEQVHKILELSYDGLREENRRIFLDIACFFNSESRDFAKRILDGCGFSAKEGIEDLIHKYLLNIVDVNKLWMQRLIETMGREVVRRESVAEPGERSRLWNPQDLCHVFEHNSETNKIEGISLDMFVINMVDVSPAVFSNMYKLRVLKFHSYSSQCKLKFPPHEEQLHSLPKNLRYLYWDGYPFISLPLQFSGLKLVELKMQYSNLERLWEGVQNLECLRVLDLSFSKQLIEIPNLSRATKVESVCLRGCVLVRVVPQYFEDLEHLNSLDLEDCSSLETVSALPRNIADVNLSRCVRLRSLPNYIPALNRLNRLQLAACSSFEYNPEILAFLKDME